MGSTRLMRAVDTNIILRLMMNDDAVQVGVARRLLAEPALVGTAVLMEAAWVMESTYELPRRVIAAAYEALLDIPTVHVPDERGVRWAIGRYRDHRADLADMLHIVAARGASSFASFEKKLASQAGEDTPVSIERPG